MIAVCITLGLFLLIDVLMGSWLLSIAMGELPKDKFRAPHPVYHHTLIPNYEGIGHWGPGTYHICTNASAFKDSCNKRESIEKVYDVAFIGDSFTEGVGLPYEDTFVGMIAAKFPDLKIANLGVVGYAPRIYLAKLSELYAQGYQFAKVIVFVDISDVQDEALTYDVQNGAIISRHEQLPQQSMAKVRRIASRWFPLTGQAWNRLKASIQNMETILSSRFPHDPNNGTESSVIAINPNNDIASASPNTPANQELKEDTVQRAKIEPKLGGSVSPAVSRSNTEPSIYARDYSRSEWTYNTDSKFYGPDGVMGTVTKMISTMDELHRLVKSHGGELSVGVYPWPGQIKHDREDSLQARIWGEFCATRCAHFYNAFPRFFDLLRQQGDDTLIRKYYMGGDMHFNKEGNAVIAQTILETGF